MVIYTDASTFESTTELCSHKPMALLVSLLTYCEDFVATVATLSNAGYGLHAREQNVISLLITCMQEIGRAHV